MLRDGRYFVPVIMSIGPDSSTPQSMALRVHFDAEGNMGEASVHKAGAAKDLAVPFEITRRLDNDLTYLISYGGLVIGESRSAVVAEIEIESAEGAVGISVDPQLTMLGDQAGQMAATVANGKLHVSGATIGKLAPHRPNEEN
jgi:hypothetical protein